jgi:Domain of unknown function (DUF4345)
MKNLSKIVKLLCVIPLLTGVMDVLLGASAFQALGVGLGTEALREPNLNSQIRFFGAIWLGFGVLLWIAANDLKANAKSFQMLCSILILSGFGRLLSAVQFGMPAPPLVAAMVVELVLIPLLLVWHKRLLT